jgi:isopropylmalate/homocitrate/citramalate synthase
MRKTIFKKLEAQGLIANYNRLRKNLPPKLPDRVFIWDETFREGIKAPTVYLTYVEQVRLAKLMDEAGVEVINVGFPAISEDEKRTVKRIVNESFTHATLVASAEATKNSINACIECGIKEIVIESPINGLNLQYKLKITKEQGLQRIVEAIDYSKKHGLKVNFNLMDGTRTPLEDIIQVFETAANAGASRIVIADSVGFMRPLSMRYLISHVATA